VPDRVVVFIDYQNSYRGARDLFHDLLAPYWEGQFWPDTLGTAIASDSPFERELVEVRVYRGLPSSERDPKGYGAAHSQITAWQRRPNTTVIWRPLRYPDDWPATKAEEKGIDVAMAIDFVMGAVKGWFDVGVVMSRDTDLKPALEVVATQLQTVRVEVAAWSLPAVHCGRLSIKQKNLWCHWLGQDVYRAAQDTTDYTGPAR
jgi:hypothetical protein